MEAAQPRGPQSEGSPHFTLDTGPDEVRAWEEIDPGRYMPRRIRGSYKGRALG